MKSFLTAALTILYLGVQAQYLPNNSQAFQFAPIINPAFSGVENFNDLKFGYRYQWTGFGENSPKFINLSYNTRLRQPLDLSYNSLRISNPSMMRPQGIPRKKRMIHGLSVNLFQSKIGVISSIGGGANFSLNYPLVRQWRLGIGAGAYLENRKLNVGEVTVRDPDNDSFYNHLLNGSTAQTDLNIRTGILLYNQEFYFGFSYLPLVYKAIKSSDVAFDKAFYKAAIQAGYAFQVNPDLAFKPSLLALVQVDNAVAVDLSVKAYVQNKVWGGITYRSVKSGIGMLGFNFNEMFSVSYAYEVSLGQFQQFSGGSHELLLAMRFNNVKKFTQYTW
jgi:type IX secretion system PorP/SprF family membrane protein